MKPVLILLLMGLFTNSTFGQNIDSKNAGRFTVSGKFPNADQRILILKYYDNDKDRWLTDTTITTKGNFNFTNKGGSNYEKVYLYNMGNTARGPLEEQKDFIQLYRDPMATTMLKIKDSLKNAEVIGSKLNQQFTYFQRVLQNSDFEQIKSFVKKNPDSQVSIDALRLLISKVSNDYFEITKPHEIDSVYQFLSSDLKNTEKGMRLAIHINGAKNTQIGSLAPDFTAKDTSGKEVTLSDFRGKYVLLDFWASWCVPCRKESPYLVKTYNKYKDSNFTILSFSNDEDPVKWKEAIVKDALNWTHVSMLQSTPKVYIDTYVRRSLPASILIDPNGFIIAKNLRGEALENELSKIIGK
jgi:peroxiredoxin